MFAHAGDRIGDYEVKQLLGRGSFGVVLLVQTAALQQFALKLVPCDHLDDDEAAKAADTTLAEAQLMQRLRHPHIVTCHDVQFDPPRKCVWLALEFMDGGDLGNRIKAKRQGGQPPFEGPFLQHVLSTVGGALCYIHSQGVLHRDVKPPNILVSNSLHEVKLADFGISKILEASGHAGFVLGTPAYMSPELVSGRPYGTAADAWALGACLFELACLKRPFDASNQLALVWQIVEHDPPELPPETPPDMVTVIRGLLNKDPSLRLRLEELVPDEVAQEIPGGADGGGYSHAPVPSPSFMSEWSGAFALPEPGQEAVPQARHEEEVSDSPPPPIAVVPIVLQRLNTEGSDLEEVLLEDTPALGLALPSPRTQRTEGFGTGFGKSVPSTPSTPRTQRRNWLSRLGRGLRIGVLGARDEAIVSAFREGEVAD
ncbi:nek8 [Symbiodinium microadriaticum]|nr:nek8 [Symbiodinium microadriaticum]